MRGLSTSTLDHLGTMGRWFKFRSRTASVYQVSDNAAKDWALLSMSPKMRRELQGYVLAPLGDGGGDGGGDG